MFKNWGLKLGFKGNFFTGSARGFKDEMKCFNDIQIKEAELSRSMLDHCLPPSKWFSEEGYTKAIKSLKNGDYANALKSLDIEKLAKDESVCIWIFQNVFLKIVTGCPRLLSEALPGTWY